METLLQQLRGVPGVSGVMIFDRFTRRKWKLLPSRFEDGDIDQLESSVAELTKGLEGDCSFTVRFSSGWLVARVSDAFVLLILAKDDLGLEVLDLVIRASLASLRHSADAQPDRGTIDDLDLQAAYVLLDAVNCVGQHFLPIIGGFNASSLLRKAKEYLLPTFPTLKHFPVDNNCNVSLIRGSEKHLDQTVVHALACLCYYFKEMVNAQTPVVGFDIRAVTARSEEELAALGFYASYRRAASKAAQIKQ